ncbi:hypothetical protein CYLTODRAFT_369569 [Cylindrobasidium torrendii FP15055 ss-10]|uniref:Uncharacterized protein n=1 Tax=Cylindrobasidium torrendii FP15055 ss-10 TaxID=1314674 RepID=A0A0D7BM30_9AGAR|nr:hypothetical protein CYLTODRAFT_369569 [Cylindrobasidium torrendii FP15055 ss-10]
MNDATGRVGLSPTEQLEDRRKARESKAKSNRDEAEKIKTEGNALFRKGLYPSAVAKYEEALEVGGTNALILNNLAAAFLQMQCYDEAEEYATRALEHDPSLVKARYRRGKARYSLKRFRGATLDFEAVSKANPDEPDFQSTAKQAKEASSRGKSTESDAEYDSADYSAPCVNQTPYTSEVDSDSEEAQTVGDGTPCYAYNHDGCDMESDCLNSHAPDEKSVRDSIARNVCIPYLLGQCEVQKCAYAHDKTYLPPGGWWGNTELIEAVASKKDHPLISHLFSSPFSRYNIPGIPFKHSTLSGCKAPAKPFFLVISLEFEAIVASIHNDLFLSLEKKALVKWAKTVTSALALITSPNVLGVLVVDGGAARSKNKRVARQLVDYTKRGGRVIIGGQFSNNSSETSMSSFFSQWGVSWKMGDYHRTTVEKKDAHPTVKANPILPKEISMKAVNLSGVDASAAMYLPSSESHLESRVFPNLPIQNLQEGPVVLARVGEGHLGYVGDVNGEVLVTPVVLAMLDYDRLTATYVPEPAAPAEGFILLLSLENLSFFDEMHTHLLSALRSKTTVMQATSSKDALRLLASPALQGVLCVDPGVTDRKHKQVADALKAYVSQHGGTVLFAGLFSSFITPPDLKKFFSSVWGLRWEMGPYNRRVFARRDAELLAADQYSMKAASLKGIEDGHAVYRDPYSHEVEAPVVRAKVGNGYVAYVGDVNAEEESTEVVLGLLKL